MAAFSFYHQPNNVVFDSFLVPYTSNKTPSVAELEPEEGSTTITATKPYFAPMLVNECSHQEIPLHAQVYESEYDPFHNIEMAMPIVDDLNQITQMVASNEEKKGKNMDIKKGEGKESKHNGVVRKQHLKKQRKKVAEEASSSSGYVHVRARRGQATDSHSLAERVRRAKISVRMKLLQSLVPGCDKIKGKAVILDEIINYVQTLQTEVEFLAAKLASISPMFNDSEGDFITNPLAQAHNDNWSWGNDNDERSQELANYYQYELSKFKSPI